MRIEELMNRYYTTFSENDRYIASCILAHKNECVHCSIEAFASNYHISKSSLSRFSQKLKLPGYSELRSIVRMQQQKKEATSSFLDVAIHNYHAMIEDMRKRDLTSLFEKMDHAKRILIFANGYSQAKVASEMKRIFLPTHKIIYDMHGSDMAISFTNMVQEQDLVVFISLDGESKDVIDIAKQLRLRQIPMVSITRMKMNTLTGLCEENLYIHALQVPADYGVAYEITTPYFILIEMLYLQYQRHYQTCTYSRNMK
ncbi:MurR/RpiR family transcriptional regulator [[Eubacterium] hominis]|uniref:MurR/RpiR family transcriptional regulator n=1 Tax=[Eubacterium] hominis TaxID=2764325 RepID=UPI003A4E2F9A